MGPETLKLNMVYRGDAEQFDEFLNELEVHLDANGITDDQEKIAVLIGSISGPPAMWYGAYRREAIATEDQSMLHFDNTILAFKKVFRASLNPAVIYEKWGTLRETGTLNECNHEFQRLLNIISREIRLDRQATAFQYTAGLREPAKGAVRNRNPNTLMAAMEYAAENARCLEIPAIQRRKEVQILNGRTIGTAARRKSSQHLYI